MLTHWNGKRCRADACHRTPRRCGWSRASAFHFNVQCWTLSVGRSRPVSNVEHRTLNIQRPSAVHARFRGVMDCADRAPAATALWSWDGRSLPKLEARNPKQIRISKSQIRRSPSAGRNGGKPILLRCPPGPTRRRSLDMRALLWLFLRSGAFCLDLWTFGFVSSLELRIFIAWGHIFTFDICAIQRRCRAALARLRPLGYAAASHCSPRWFGWPRAFALHFNVECWTLSVGR